MVHFNTLGATACIILLSTTEVLGSYKYLPEINGWVMIHKIIAKWEDAFEHCENQSAVLMSPNNMELYSAMVGLNEDNSTYFIGAKSYDKKLFVSIEGVPLYDMPVSHMSSELDSQDGDCLSMNRDIIRVVPCAKRLHYICYKEKTSDLVLTECGTFDEGYQLNNSTGSCYKYHHEQLRWTEAYAACMNEGAYLVIINDGNEKNVLIKLFGSKEVNGYFLIGVQSIEKKGHWRSIHGQRVPEISGIPVGDNVNIPRPFGGMYPSRGSMYSLDATYQRHFLCKKDPNYIMFPEQ